ncbi:hypothetical protein [Spiroplasma turonicum]|uniref:Uncharacterized protein n=1 Tax=Spiroplasma turonicum TaxID=216946 RepID=A0A0K1P5Q8_9MOLU|nr:hypothetical protein [Spiroplasma turonicum]AKU79666.1 hypothetical protein STURON_00420 [Spiroplasma turonicum]ALX70686.1 hypothetical protein STURO_v1c04180 [Spiroplasma turonicum]
MTVKFADNEDKIYESLGNDINSAWDVTYNANENVTYSWKNEQTDWKDESIAPNKALYDYIMHKDNGIQTIVDDSGESQSQENIKAVEEYVKSNYINKWYKNYLSEVESFDSKLKSDTELNAIVKKTTSIKNLKLKGLVIKIGEYESELDGFSIVFGYTTNNKDFESSESESSNENYKSVLANLEAGIKSFQDTFGVEKPTSDKKAIAYTGKSNNESITKNLWDTYDMAKISNNDKYGWIYLWQKTQISNLNQYLSLKAVDQAEFRNNLLTKGNQSDFSIEVSYSPKEQIPVRLALSNNNNEGDKTNGFIIDGYYDKSLVTSVIRYMDIKFKLNFININFRVDSMFVNHSNRWNSLIQKL